MARLEVRLSDAELGVLKDRAWADRVSVSEFVRRLLALPVVVEREAVFVPDEAPVKVVERAMAEANAAREKPPATVMPKARPLERREVSPMFKRGGS